MRVLTYNDLNSAAIPGFAKVKAALEAGNFTQADVRKIGPNLYRARLNKADRLLFRLHRHGDETCCLLLEHIPNHAYDKSRFLSGGAVVDEAKIPAVPKPQDEPAEPLVYLNPAAERFNLLDKIISFDDDQQAVYTLPAPLVIIGSAGSGKTALTLEKMKQATGDVLYVSLSPYLVHNSRGLYYANGYDNDAQSLDFLSFHEFLESIHVPEGREVTARDFRAWAQRQSGVGKAGDAHKLYEEFRGVITGPVVDRPWLAREDYLALGVKQSIFSEAERPRVYELFEKYRQHLPTQGLYDANIVSQQYLARAEKRYDFVVVDEVQDITSVQLYLILKTLRAPGAFLLTGDSNQIVHPNFFSWAKVKTLFVEQQRLAGHGEVIRVLHANYRNTAVVTEVANRILKLKHARFGSIDRESNYLVRSVAEQPGRLQLLDDSDSVKRELNTRTKRSTQVAVLVMHPQQKDEARRWFDTPLIFSVQEAKGLEYESIVLFNMVSAEEKAFREIAADVDPEALERDGLAYARGKDKHDRSLEVYKFYINALYVAATRAVKNLYLVEADHRHPLMRLLQLDRFTGELAVDKQDSSLDDWQKEARKLELQGKDEQARDIRERILQHKPVPWPVLDRPAFEALHEKALVGGKKDEQLLALEYAVLYHHRPTLNALERAGFKPATQREDKAMQQLVRKHFMVYDLKNPGGVLADTQKYGLDHRTRFNLTPLMVAARLGNVSVVEALIERGADPELTANNGFTALHFALEQALTDPKFARDRIGKLYPLLAPDSVSVQVDGRLVKIDQRLMEYVLLNAAIALYYRHLGPKGGHLDAFNAGLFTDSLQTLPDNVLPERRKKRQYISSVLSRNEVDRDGPYNRRLFLRIKRGQYLVNPALRLWTGDRWLPVAERLPPEDLGILPYVKSAPPETVSYLGAIPGQRYFEQFDQYAEENLAAVRAILRGAV